MTDTREAKPGFTPGPWHYDDGYIFDNADGNPICCIEIEPDRDVNNEEEAQGLRRLWAQQHANARLIAAAPDLLVALQDLTERYVDLINSGDCGFWDPEQEHPVIAARAAIAKATGAP